MGVVDVICLYQASGNKHLNIDSKKKRKNWDKYKQNVKLGKGGQK